MSTNKINQSILSFHLSPNLYLYSWPSDFFKHKDSANFWYHNFSVFAFGFSLFPKFPRFPGLSLFVSDHSPIGSCNVWPTVFLVCRMDFKRWRWRWVLVFIGVVATSASETKQQVVSRIAFGSCSNQSAPQVPILSPFVFLFPCFIFIPVLFSCFVYPIRNVVLFVTNFT